jgi:hypothetical protein
VGSEDLEELIEARKKISDRLKALGARSETLADELTRIDAREEQIEKALESASSEDKEALLFEAGELRREGKAIAENIREEAKNEAAELESIREEMAALDERTGPAREAFRTAATEIEKMYFEVFKLVATLAIGSIVAISAVTPALFPRLGNLEGLWPAYGWLLFSLASAVVACTYLALSIGTTLTRSRTRRKGWLGRKVPERVSRQASSIIYAALMTLPLFSLLNGLWKFTTFVSSGLG